MTFISLVAPLTYNVLQYGADNTGVADSTSAINNAIAAASSGGIVSLPPGVYKTSGSVVINNDAIILQGSGWDTIIRPVSGAQFDVISTPIPASIGLSGYVRNYIGVRDLMIDCSSMSGTTAGQGNGIHLYGSRYGYFSNVFIQSCKNWAILSDGDNTAPGSNFGYDNVFHRCVFDLCNANVWTVNSEANQFLSCQFKWAGSATAALQPTFATQDTTAMHCRCSGGYIYMAGNVFGKGGTYTTEAIRLSNSGPCRVIGNRFDQVRNQAIVMNGGNHTFSFNQLGSPGSAISGVPAIQLGSSNNIVVGNKFDTTAGAINATYCISESGGPFSGNIIADNNLLTGTSGLINQNATSTNRIHHNPGYNPLGHAVTQPAVAASGTAMTNNSGVDCTVFVTGGTVTAIAIGGTTTGLTSGAFRVPAAQTITYTYSVAPTHQWFAD